MEKSARIFNGYQLWMAAYEKRFYFNVFGHTNAFASINIPANAHRFAGCLYRGSHLFTAIMIMLRAWINGINEKKIIMLSCRLAAKSDWIAAHRRRIGPVAKCHYAIHKMRRMKMALQTVARQNILDVKRKQWHAMPTKHTELNCRLHLINFFKEQKQKTTTTRREEEKKTHFTSHQI